MLTGFAPPAPRRGAVIVLTLVMLLVLFGFAGLTIDNGYLFDTHGEVQSAADAGALAGASALYTDSDEIFERARTYTGINFAAQKPVEVLAGDIQLGNWNFVGRGAFTPINDPDSPRVNAVRVVGSRHTVPTFFAGLFGVGHWDVDRGATAHRVPGCAGIWGIERVTVVDGDIRTDSYLSADGPYSPGAFRENGDVCSNGPIALIGNAEIHGDAQAGPGYQIDVDGSAEITGGTYSASSVMPFPPVDFGDIRTNNNNSAINWSLYRTSVTSTGAINFSINSDLVLPPGRYYFGSIAIAGQARIVVEGPVTMYVTGDVRMTGGSIYNSTAVPSNLTIYSTGRSFDLHGGAGFFGSLYAPTTTIRMTGNSQYYGQIVGREVQMGGEADIHVDESLNLWTRAPGSTFLVQ